MRTQLLTLIAGSVTLLILTFPAPRADTIGAATNIDSFSTPAAPAAAVPDSPVHPAQRAIPADTMSHRDSTLRSVLLTLAKEDSLNAMAQPAAAPMPIPSHTQKNRSIPRIVTLLSNNIPLMFIIIISGIFIMLIVVIVVRVAGKRAEKRFLTTTRLSLMDSEVQHACLHIEKHYRDAMLAPASVCAAIVTGETFLEALFMRELGMSIAGYITQVRVHRAKQFIRANPGADIQTVAMQVGFGDVKSFEERFEKLTGSNFEKFERT